MTEELKPKECYLCKGFEWSAFYQACGNSEDEEWQTVQIKCDHCGCSGGSVIVDEDRPTKSLILAIKVWDTRPIEDELEQRVKALEEKRDFFSNIMKA